MSKLYLSIIFLILISCKTEPRVEHVYFPNGEIQTTLNYFQNDSIFFTEFDSTGLKFSDGYIFSSNKPGTKTTYYKNGNIKEIATVLDGEFIGSIYKYHKNGTLSVNIPYENGKQNGISKIFRENGTLVAIHILKNDSIAYFRSYLNGDTLKYNEKFLPSINYLKKNDTCKINFSIYSGEFSNQAATYKIKFDFESLPHENKLYYPKNEIILKNGKAKTAILKDNNEPLLLYGVVSSSLDSLVEKASNFRIEIR